MIVTLTYRGKVGTKAAIIPLATSVPINVNSSDFGLGVPNVLELLYAFGVIPAEFFRFLFGQIVSDFIIELFFAIKIFYHSFSINLQLTSSEHFRECYFSKEFCVTSFYIFFLFSRLTIFRFIHKLERIITSLFFRFGCFHPVF